MCSSVLDPMAQDIPEQDIVMGEQELPPQMDPKPEMGAVAAEAAVYDTSPSLLRNPPPIPAEAAQLSAPDIAQICAMLAAMSGDLQQIKNNMDGNAQQMENKMDGMKEEIKNNTNGMREEMKEMRGEMRQVGRCLQADKMATPRAGSSELKGSAPAGEDRVIRETCWARRVEETETVTQTLKGEIGKNMTAVEGF